MNLNKQKLSSSRFKSMKSLGSELLWCGKPVLVWLLVLLALISCSKESAGGKKPMNAERFRVTLDPILNGKLSLTPAVVSGEEVPEGMLITVEAQPDEGYVLDSLYYAIEGEWGPQYYESMTPSLTVQVKQPLRIGAAFLRKDLLSGIEVIQDVVYAQPGVKPLKYDVFRPVGAQDLPLIVIIHGGGWRINDENIMRGMAREMAKTGKYVVASIDYRWLGTLDGDKEPTQIWQLIEDVFGALVHIQEHAREYGATPSRIALTGDSAGGHLCASAAVMVERIGSKGFVAPDHQFKPTYLSPGKTAEDVRSSLLRAIKVVAPSYGVFGGPMLAQAVGIDESLLKYVSPIEAIPPSDKRTIPHYLIRGNADPLISQEMVRSYAEALKKAGQTVQYVEVEGAGHAFFDWKPDAVTRKTFERYGVPYIRDMLNFFDKYL